MLESIAFFFLEAHDQICDGYNPVGKIAKKNSLMKECIFVNSALKIQCQIQCQIVKNTDSYRLLFRRFCPLGKTTYLQEQKRSTVQEIAGSIPAPSSRVALVAENQLHWASCPTSIVTVTRPIRSSVRKFDTRMSDCGSSGKNWQIV